MMLADLTMKCRVMAAALPATTDVDRALAIRGAIEREVSLAGGTRGVSVAAWDEIKGETLENLLSANADALTDDLFEMADDFAAREATIARILQMIKTGSEMLGHDYLAGCGGRGRGVSAYEEAAGRFGRAAENYPRAKAEAERILRAADAEYEAAQAELRKYEQSPGIPLPEYREE